MVITHRSSPALSKSKLNFGLQSSLLRSSFLMENSLKQIRPSTSQWVCYLLNRFYRAKDDFYRSNRIPDFQRTKTLDSAVGIERQALYPRAEPRGFTAKKDNIDPVKVRRHWRHAKGR